MTSSKTETPALAAVLQKLRGLSGLSREEVASSLQLSRQTIYHWEIGHAKPYEKNIQRLIAFYSKQPLLRAWLKPEHITAPDPDKVAADYDAFLARVAAVAEAG